MTQHMKQLPADVLVIDDDEITRDLLGDWLEAAGYRVRKVAGSAAALAEVERSEPALVVTDMCMPGAGGDTIIRELKQAHPLVPILAISGPYGRGGSGRAAA